MLYRLALALGEFDVESLAERMSWKQFVGWCQYYALEPWGPLERHRAAGVVASAVVNTQRARRTDRVWSPADFFPLLAKKRAAAAAAAAGDKPPAAAAGGKPPRRDAATAAALALGASLGSDELARYAREGELPRGDY